MTELRFVTAEEAAKWPEGTLMLCAWLNAGGKVGWYVAARKGKEDLLIAYLGLDYPADRFARLPESLPEADLTDQRPEAAS